MDRELTLVEHLDELRGCIIISLVALCIATIVSIPFAAYLLKILKSPASGLIEKLAFFSPQEAFLIYMRLSFISGFAIAFPVIAYQFWRFMSPAIEDRFKRYIVHFIFFSTATFILGALFAYFVLLPKALKFLFSFGLDELEPVISASRYIAFATTIILGCGLVFQMPVLSYILTKMGLINAKLLRTKFKFAIVIIFVIAAIITPTTDIFNMSILAIPMLFLYEVSIWVSSLVGRRKA